MKVFKLALKNLNRQKLRTLLTILGIAIAILAFGLIRTIITAWYAGVDASAQNRLVVRSSVSLVFPLPVAYRQEIAQVANVESVGLGTWFGGYFKDPKDFFANFAVDEEYLKMYPEVVLPAEQQKVFAQERNACVIGRKLAERYGWKLGDSVRLVGTIFPGYWDLVVRGIYKGGQKNTDETMFFLHWEYLNERMKQESPDRADKVGWFMAKIPNSVNPALVSEQVDARFRNSRAETKTETERAFQQGFVSMSGSIIASMQVISAVVIFIILLVLANTMAMTARERMTEFAVLRTLGFKVRHLVLLIGGESLLIAMLGFLLGYVFLYNVCYGFGQFLVANLSNFFPVFELKMATVLMAFGAAMIVGGVAAVIPIGRAVSMRVADGLSRIG